MANINYKTLDIQEEPVAVVQAQIGQIKYKTVISSDKHQIIADEPEVIEGGDTGMDPHELLLASLGSCTAITLRMYINRKMWAIDEITVDLEMYKHDNHSKIKRTISFKGEISEMQQNRLLQIADACPIHKILTAGVAIETVIEQP